MNTDPIISYDLLHYVIWGLILSGLGWALGSYAWEWFCNWNLKRRRRAWYAQVCQYHRLTPLPQTIVVFHDPKPYDWATEEAREIGQALHDAAEGEFLGIKL